MKINPFFLTLPGLRAAEMTALPANIIQEAKAIAPKVNQQLCVWASSLKYHVVSIWCFKPDVFSLCMDHCNYTFTMCACKSKTNFQMNETNIRHLKTHNVVSFCCSPNIKVIPKHRCREPCTTWPLASCRLRGTPDWTRTACECI